jgi:hypothetical protein
MIFEVLMPGSMEITAFWNGILCISVDRYHVSEQYSASIFREKNAWDYSSTLNLEVASFSETLVLIYELCGVMSQKTVLFK